MVAAAGQAEAVRCAPCGFCRVFGGNSRLRRWRAVEVFGSLSIIDRRRRGARPRTAIAYSRDRSASRPGKTSGPKRGFYHRIRSMTTTYYLFSDFTCTFQSMLVPNATLPSLYSWGRMGRLVLNVPLFVLMNYSIIIVILYVFNT